MQVNIFRAIMDKMGWYNPHKNNYTVQECSDRCVKISGGSMIGTEGARIVMRCSHGELKLEWGNAAWKRIE
jgi:hypothetical protein